MRGDDGKIKCEGTTEKFTETQRETKEGTPETREVEQEKVNEIWGNKDKEHTHIELVRDNEVELMECFATRCEQQDSSLRNRGRKYALSKQIVTR